MAVSSGQAGRKAIRALSGCLPWWMTVALLLSGVVAAQSARPDDAAPVRTFSPADCDSLDVYGAPDADGLRKVCQYAVTLPDRMPNFTCEQRTSRYREDQQSDIVTAQVTYQDGQESYSDVRADGAMVTDAARLKSRTWSTGQFGADVRGIFDAANDVSFELADSGRGGHALTFRYEVPRQAAPLWQLHANGHVATPPYHGELRIDPNTGTLLRVKLVADELPDDFPLRSADVEIEYQDVPFGDGSSFVLPVKSVVDAVNRDGKRNRNVLEFYSCHKFRATARMLPGAPSPAP